MKLFKRLAGLAILLWLLTFAAVLAVSAFWPQDAPPPAPADAIVCLGAGTTNRGADGESRRRAAACTELYQAGVAPLVVFTGYGDATRSAGEAMAELAVRAGVPAEAALVEPAALSTIQNAAFGLALLPEQPARVVVVSDPFHLPRSWAIFRAFGVPDVAVHAAASRNGPFSRQNLLWAFRESFAIWSNLGRLAAYLGGGVLGIDAETRIGWFD